MRYEFLCPQCGKTIVIGMNYHTRFPKCHDFDFPVCLDCNKDMKPLVSGGNGFQLHGNGWSKDGYCGAWDVDQIVDARQKRGELID